MGDPTACACCAESTDDCLSSTSMTTEAEAVPTSTSGIDPSKTYYVVQACRAGRGRHVWVHWLGYSERRSCWRQAPQHFLGASSLADVCEMKASVSSRVVQSLPEAAGPELQSRPVSEVCTPRGGPPKRSQFLAPRRAAKKKRKEYTTKVHTIRVGSSGVQEIMEVRQKSLKHRWSPAPTSVADSNGAEEADANGDAGSSSATPNDSLHGQDVTPGGGAADQPAFSADGAGPTPPSPGNLGRSSKDLGGFVNRPAAASGAWSFGVSTFSDERAQLWEQHRLLNERVYSNPHGYWFRLEIAERTAEDLTLRWVFPESTPGDCSAWIGMFDASDFDWPRAAPRPRYVRYKSLTSSKKEGKQRFSSKDFAGLPDGVYVFSIDTGNLPLSAGLSENYCVSQRIRITDQRVEALIGVAHGCPLQPRSRTDISRLLSKSAAEASASRKKQCEGTGAEGSDDDGDSLQQCLFPVPVLDMEASEESAAVKQVYALVDRLSYLDWGLCTKDGPTSLVRAKRQPSGSEQQIEAPSEKEDSGQLLGEGACVPGKALTAVTSEGYGEATCATAERLLRGLINLTHYVPAMAGWDGRWNLSADSTFLDIGSGYGKVVLHAKLASNCRTSYGIECVPKRVEISTLALQGCYGELDRHALDDDLLKGVSFCCADATDGQVFNQSHVYAFDRVFSDYTLDALAKVLQRSSFFVFVSSKAPHVWWGHGLTKIQPVAKMRFATTGRERCTAYIYVNSHFIPGMF